MRKSALRSSSFPVRMLSLSRESSRPTIEIYISAAVADARLGRYTHIASLLQVRNALIDHVKKEGIDETNQAIFAFLIERVRQNLHVVLCMSPVGEAFRSVVMYTSQRDHSSVT